VRLRLKDDDQGRDEAWPTSQAASITPFPAAWTGPDDRAVIPVDEVLDATPPSLALLRDGFEDRALSAPGDDQAVRLWRLGRWLATQTTRRPVSLQIIDDWTVVIDRRVLQIDTAGNIRDLSPWRSGQGTRLASLACWGRRR
jgi:hypothetical protein